MPNAFAARGTKGSKSESTASMPRSRKSRASDACVPKELMAVAAFFAIVLP
jgi:hypothetical protein